MEEKILQGLMRTTYEIDLSINYDNNIDQFASRNHNLLKASIL